jgi:16S rRNA processing protein RimM
MADERFVAIARVAKTHGLKGEVSVAPSLEISFESFVGLNVWFTPPTSSLRSGRIDGVRQGPKGPLVKLDSVNSIDTASTLVGKELLALASELPEGFADSTDDPNDVVGFAVVDEQRGAIGDVSEILITGANDVWVVHGRFGEVLIPVIDDVIIAIDDQERTLHVRLLEGLIDEESDQR